MRLTEEQLYDYSFLRELYRTGKLGGLDEYERELLEFCHNTDMPKYLKENVWDKPIVLDENGNLDRERTLYHSNSYQEPQNQYVNPYQTPQQPPRPQMPQVNEQKFYYLYDDNGNLIAAIPQR